MSTSILSRAHRRSRNAKLAFAVATAVFLVFTSTTVAQTSPAQEEELKAASTLFDEGFELFQKGTAESLRAAIVKFETANELFRQVGDKFWQASTLIAMGRIANDLGEKTLAIERYKTALPLFHALGETLGEITTLNNIAAAYTTLGENHLALKYFEQSLPLIRELSDKQMEATVLSNLGGVHALLGDQKTALKFYEESLTIVRAVDDKQQEATTLSNVGHMHSKLTEHQTALTHFEQALSVARLIKDKRLEATILSNIGVTHSHLGNKRKALEMDNEALALRRSVGDREGEGATLNNIGTEYLELGEAQKALENFSEALILRRASEDVLGEAVTLDNIMGTWRVLGNKRLAIFYGKQSVNTYQRLRAKIRELSIELQRTYLRSIEDTYRHLSVILITEGRLSEAQQTLNSLKDQQFFDFEQTPRTQPAHLALTSRETRVTAEYERTMERVEAAGKQLEEMKQGPSNSGSGTKKTTQLGQLESSYKRALDEFRTFLKHADSEFSQPLGDEDQVGEVDDTRAMQTALRDLSQKTGQRAVAVYQLVSDKDFYLILLTAEGVKAVSTPIDDAVLEEQALQFWALLQSDEYDPKELSHKLYNIIFRPLEKELPKDTKTLLWSLDGNLRYLPMAALYDGQQYLVERYNHVSFTRADSERMTSAVTRNWTATGLGTSAAHTVDLLGDKIKFGDLPGVGEELRLLFKRRDNPQGIFEGETLQDARFTKAAMLSALKQKRPLVHIASHFAFRPGDEDRSFLLLGDGTAFTLAEMKQQGRLFDGVELLTLSACNTAAQRAGANGREVDAFAELAQRLGANAVMATLWPVADSSTPWLMREFYRTRKNQTFNKAGALRRAQLSLLHGEAAAMPATRKRLAMVQVLADAAARQSSDNTRADLVFVEAKYAMPFKKDSSKPFAHPYYWSPFILVGNWQ